MPELVADMTAGTLKPFYQCDKRPDVTTTPVPRWDLIHLKDYAVMPLQFSRGCPFNCEFCDIIVMNGRVPRVKTPRPDDPRAGHPGRRRLERPRLHRGRQLHRQQGEGQGLLRELIAWRAAEGNVSFSTEASLNLADEPELLS